LEREGNMSIWSFDLGIDPSWPEWFQQFRREHDAELRAKAEACVRGEMTEDEFKAWALESSQRHVEWIDALPADRRAWIEAEEAADRHVVVLPEGARAERFPLDAILELGRK
jgi:hypothetical protein